MSAMIRIGRVSSVRRQVGRAFFSSLPPRFEAPPMVFITGEEMSHYTMNLIRKKWIEPFMDTSKWKYYDLSCKERDATNDQVLRDAVQAGADIGAIFKEPTITPTLEQRLEMDLKKPLGSPNGAMRRGWHGITISRDTIHIEGMELGFKNPVYFERHAVGGEYGAGFGMVGKGVLKTIYYPDGKVDGAQEIDSREITDNMNAVVTYHNPLDNVEDLAHHFFSRCLKGGIVPYVVTKKTVFKWQEDFWAIMKRVFDQHYLEQFRAAGLLDGTGGELRHLISDAATMQIIRWTKGGFGMAAHNYDGDMLTDEVAQVHRSPGFITSTLIGKLPGSNTLIKEYEASHGTVADLWHAHLRGEETSFNPLGMTEAFLGALSHAATLDTKCQKEVEVYTATLRRALHKTFLYGQGTRDMAGADGKTTEQFIDIVADRFTRYLKHHHNPPPEKLVTKPDPKFRRNYNVDSEAVRELFAQYDLDGDGTIDVEEFEAMLQHMGVAPKKFLQITNKHKIDERDGGVGYGGRKVWPFAPP